MGKIQSAVIAKPISRREIRRFANKIREITGLTNDPLFPIVHFLENVLPQMWSNYDFEVVADAEMDTREGESYPDERRIVLPESVYEGALNGNGRDRFTATHECGHLFMHRKDRIALARRNPNGPIKSYEDPEWQANAFSAELLMPAHLVKKMTVPEIIKNCQVSKRAAQIRFEQVN